MRRIIPLLALAALLACAQSMPPAEGTLTQVLYIFSPIPIGPGGAVVMAEANAGKVANALLYRAAVGGIQQAIMNAFTAV